MWFYSIVFFTLIAFNGLAYYYRLSKVSYAISLFFLMIIAAFRPSSCCADYGTYVDYYNYISGISYTFLEPSYFLIVKISKFLFNGPIGVFIIYSILGVSLKGIAIKKLTKYYTVSLILYFGSFFLLHEMTQIRVGVASGILLLSILYIKEEKFIKFILSMVVGCLFHYSLIIFVPFYFVDRYKINKFAYIGSLVGIYIITLAGINFLTILQYVKLGFLSAKISTYQLLLQQGVFGGISIINPLLYLRMGIVIFFIINHELLIKKNVYAVIIIKIYFFSVLAFIGFSALPVLAGRVSQLLGVVEIILVPYGIYILKPKYVAAVLFVIFALLIMYKQLYYSDLMSGYFDF